MELVILDGRLLRNVKEKSLNADWSLLKALSILKKV